MKDMMFWKKSQLESKEYLDLKQELAMVWIELDVLTQRYKRRVTKKADSDEEIYKAPFDDGFDEIRKINKGK